MKKVIRRILETMATLALICVMAVSVSIAFSVMLPIIAICDAIMSRKSLAEAYAYVLDKYFDTIKKNF